jgi:protein gp37
MLPDFTKPKFYESRIVEPYKIKKPSIVFVCSMGDIFGCEDGIVRFIITAMRDNPQHIFMVLTKRPEEYIKYQWPKNVMLGVTETKSENRALSGLHIGAENKTFVSAEPLLGMFDNPILANLVIVGAQTGPGAAPPKREWVDSIKHHNLFYKGNIVKLFPDLPQGNKKQIWDLFKDRMEKK